METKRKEATNPSPGKMHSCCGRETNNTSRHFSSKCLSILVRNLDPGAKTILYLISYFAESEHVFVQKKRYFITLKSKFLNASACNVVFNPCKVNFSSKVALNSKNNQAVSYMYSASVRSNPSFKPYDV